jgi:hypothetical protein
MSTTVRETEKFKRRWFRFSLRTLFAAVTVFALLFGWIGWNVWQVRARDKFHQRLILDGEALSGLRRLRNVGEEARPPMIWELLGAQAEESIYLSREKYTDEEIRRIEALFPEADICISDHHSYGWPPDRWGAHLIQDKP